MPIVKKQQMAFGKGLDGLIFDAVLFDSLRDRVSGTVANFERASIAGCPCPDGDSTVAIDEPCICSDGLHLRGAAAVDPITGVARATEAADALGNGVSWLLDDIPLVKAALQDEGTMVLDGALGFDKADVSTGMGLVTTSDVFSSILFLTSSGNFRSRDGTNNADNTVPYSSGDNLQVRVTWESGGTFDVYVNGIAGISNTFDGAYPIGLYLRLCFGNEMSQEFFRLRFWNRRDADV